MIAMIWRWLTGYQVAGVAGVNMRGDFGRRSYFGNCHLNSFVDGLVIKRPFTITVDKSEIKTNSVEVVRLNTSGFERTHRVFWFVFEWTLGQLLAWWIQKKSIRLIKKSLSEQEKENWKTADGRRQILGECRRNFGKKRIAELFKLRTRLFNWSSTLLQHFCRHVANAEALDDVYNALGSFSLNGQRLYPESAKPDLFSNFYLSCPNAQSVRNRYRQVAKLYKESGGRRILSVACGSAQPLINATYVLKAQGQDEGIELILTDINREALNLAKRRVGQAGVSDKVSCHQVAFFDLNKVVNGNKFDIVEACGILDYLPDHHAERLLKFALDVLNRGGMVIASNMAETRGANLLRKMYNWEINYRSPEEFGQLIRQAGGRDIKIYVEPWGIHPVATFTN